MKILIVDDEIVVVKILEHALTSWGHTVKIARNGREAWDIIRAEQIRFVISDWVMPQMDGLQLCQAIRAEGFPGYVYTILLTSRSEKEDIVEGLNAGADDFLIKPFNPAELEARVRTGLRVLNLETRDLTIFAMAKLAESRDPETGAHLERVRSYSRVLAQHLSGVEKFRSEITSSFVANIYATSPLHDIGKVAIPDSVLLKPARLDDREFEIMKTHTTIGAQTLDAALHEHPGAKYLQMARDIAATHHERYDGTGYPAGLKGDQIPLCGRIVALADVYDALVSRRVYKNAFTHDVARSIIVQERGTHFDPDIVDAFIKVEQQFIRIRVEFAEDQKQAA